MREEMSRNEDVEFHLQNDKVKAQRGDAANTPHRYVNPVGVIVALLLVLGALCLWLLRLLGVISLHG